MSGAADLLTLGSEAEVNADVTSPTFDPAEAAPTDVTVTINVTSDSEDELADLEGIVYLLPLTVVQ